MSEKAIRCSAWTLPCASRSLGSSAFNGKRLVLRGVVVDVAPRQKGLQCDAVFADHVRPLRTVEVPEHETRNILFAVDDSDAAQEGARFTMDSIARPGDCVHFVHVIADNRVPLISVGGVTEGSEDVFYGSSVDVTEAFPLKEHQDLLELRGEQMMKKRLMNMIEAQKEIKTDFHLPIMTRPESASEIASVICDLASELKVDILSIVSPSSGVFLECGSVGYHCYENSAVPVLLLPDTDLQMQPDSQDNVMVLLVNSESERESAESWLKRHMSHIFDPDKLFVACLDSTCTMEVPQSTKDMAKELERTSTKLQPACVILYASTEMTVLDQLQGFPFIEEYSADNRFPILLLPRIASETHDHKTYWNDFTYSAAEILQT